MEDKRDGGSLSKQASIENCTFIKMILMLLVILYHACAYWTGAWFTKDPILQSQSLSILAKWLNSFHVYGFVFVSGYIFAFARNERGKYRNRKDFLFGKAKRLLVPFCFVVTIWVIPLQQYFFHYSIGEIITNYIFAENPNQLWFLWMLFVVFVVISFVIEAIDYSWIIATFISVIGYGIYLVLLGRVVNCFQIIMAMQYLSVFIAGYYMRKIGLSRIQWFVWLIIDIVLFCVYEFVPDTGLALKIMHYGVGFVLHLVGSVMAWVSLQALANKINWKESKAFKTVSSYSMPMYLFHQQIIYFTIVWLNGKVNPWINAGVNFAAAIIGSFLISAVLMHWKTTRFLIGEK